MPKFRFSAAAARRHGRQRGRDVDGDRPPRGPSCSTATSQPISIREKKSILQFEITQKKVNKRELMHLCRQLAVFLRSGVSVLEAPRGPRRGDVQQAVPQGAGRHAGVPRSRRPASPTPPRTIPSSSRPSTGRDPALGRADRQPRRGPRPARRLPRARNRHRQKVKSPSPTRPWSWRLADRRLGGAASSTCCRSSRRSSRRWTPSCRCPPGCCWRWPTVRPTGAVVGAGPGHRRGRGRLLAPEPHGGQGDRDRLVLQAPAHRRPDPHRHHRAVLPAPRLDDRRPACRCPTPSPSPTAATNNTVFRTRPGRGPGGHDAGRGSGRAAGRHRAVPRRGPPDVRGRARTPATSTTSCDAPPTTSTGSSTTSIKRFTNLIEPAVIIVVGVIVGFVAIALVSAMYGIFRQVQGHMTT